MVNDASIGNIPESIGVVPKGQCTHLALQPAKKVWLRKPWLVGALLLPRPSKVAAQAMDEDETGICQ